MTAGLPNEPLLMKKRHLASMLGVSARTIDNWVAQRVIPYIATSPRMHLFDPIAVKNSLASTFGIKALPLA